MKIAIADDRAEDLKAAETYLRKYIGEHYPDTAMSMQLDTFDSAEDLLYGFQPGKYDLLMLDIYMKAMTGMQAAEIIRKQDTQVSIVFLTSSSDHILAGYRVFAAGYFLKPLADHAEDFAKTFDFLFPHLLEKSRSLFIQLKGEDVEIPYRGICYVDINEKHKLCFHLEDETIEIFMPYNECRVQLLRDERFMECHHRIIVNMEFIRRMDTEEFLLKNETIIPISKRKQKEAKIKYMQYLAHKI